MISKIRNTIFNKFAGISDSQSSDNIGAHDKRTKDDAPSRRESREVYPSDNFEGLRNTKNRCYMNAMLQALSSSKKLVDQLSKIEPRRVQLDMFIKLLIVLYYPNCREDFTGLLDQFMSTIQWHLESQQDAFQLLSFVIKSLQNELGLTNVIMPPKFKLLHTFSENNKFNKVQSHLGLALPLCGSFTDPAGVHITTLLDAFFQPSKIDDDHNETASFLFEQAPEVLVFHIQANEWCQGSGRYFKPRYYINYDETLLYPFEIHKKVDGTESETTMLKYELRAVVHHIGDIHGGHYITYKKSDQCWYLTNDSEVKETSFDCKVIPYIMVYEKILDDD